MHRILQCMHASERARACVCRRAGVMRRGRQNDTRAVQRACALRAISVSTCRLSEHRCWRADTFSAGSYRGLLHPSGLCGGGGGALRSSESDNRTAAIVTSQLCEASRGDWPCMLMGASLVRLVRSLRGVGTRLPIVTLVDPSRRFPAVEAELIELGVQLLPAQNIPPPKNANVWHKGTFGKLQIVNLTQFERVIFLDSDAQVLRNIDILASKRVVPAPAFVFHQASLHTLRHLRLKPWKKVLVMNSGVMVVEPNAADAARMSSLIASGEAAPGSDQEVWNLFFRGTRTYELPLGYNFHTDTSRVLPLNVSDEELRRVHVLHRVYGMGPTQSTIERHIRSCARGKLTAGQALVDEARASRRTDEPTSGIGAGYCNETQPDPDDCMGGRSGSWRIGDASGIRSLAGCAAACACCPACRYVSFSDRPEQMECSWYARCDRERLKQHPPGYVTLEVARTGRGNASGY